MLAITSALCATDGRACRYCRMIARQSSRRSWSLSSALMASVFVPCGTALERIDVRSMFLDGGLQAFEPSQAALHPAKLLCHAAQAVCELVPCRGDAGVDLATHLAVVENDGIHTGMHFAELLARDVV